MTNSGNEPVTEEDALNGLMDAARYCEKMGWNDTGREIADLYQRVARLGTKGMEDE